MRPPASARSSSSWASTRAFSMAARPDSISAVKKACTERVSSSWPSTRAVTGLRPYSPSSE